MAHQTKPGLPPGEEERYREYIARQQRLHREKVEREQARRKVTSPVSSESARKRIEERERKHRHYQQWERLGIMALLVGFLVLLWLAHKSASLGTQDPAQLQWAKGLGLPVEVTNSVGMVMRLIPAGSFTMGSPKSEEHHRPDETQHKVRIPHSFYMASTETTQKQYEQLMEANPSYFGGGPDTPVDSVLWEEALEFCNRLSRREGFQPVYERGEDGWVCHVERTGYRLPVEAEWEFACRAGTVGPLYITPHWLSRREPTPQPIAWYLRNSGGQPQRVGRQEPNPWGLHDMLGNVREWVWDRYDRYPVLREVRLLGSQRGEDRIVRGGGWFSEPKDVRAAARRRWPPDLRWKSVGFRVVRTVER